MSYILDMVENIVGKMLVTSIMVWAIRCIILSANQSKVFKFPIAAS